MTTPATAEELREAQAKEYSQYVALGPIDINGARAFNEGDPVPASHIERALVSTEQVARTSTKAGRAAAGLDDNTKG